MIGHHSPHIRSLHSAARPNPPGRPRIRATMEGNTLRRKQRKILNWVYPIVLLIAAFVAAGNVNISLVPQGRATN